jgi:hypothetical protein
MLQSYNPYLALEEDAVLVDAIGEPLVRTHVAVVQAAMARKLPPEEVALTAAEPY